MLSAQTRSIAVERKNTIAVFGGMGVHMVSASDVVNYINSVSTFAQRVDEGSQRFRRAPHRQL